MASFGGSGRLALLARGLGSGRFSSARRGASGAPSAAKLRFALVDIDGTLVAGEGAIPGAAAALDRLRTQVEGVRFVTNQSMEASRKTFSRLRSLGLTEDDREVFGSLAAARRIVDSLALRPLLLLRPEALEEFEGVPTHEPNAVVLGTAPEHLHYEGLMGAMRVLLADPDSQLIAVNKGRYFRAQDGFVPMAGPFVAALEFATGKTATVAGKPSASFFHAAVRDVSGAEEASEVLPRCVMIGDDAADDVQGAMDAGIPAILLRTGKYRPGDERRCRTQPLGVVDSFPEAVDLLESKGLL